ncbi:MAG: S-layer homology domain-containing protein, partial [Clostridia bacterium]|nr:S-layer homology domain-containing protein [Clostridia bacterium]
AMRWAVGRGLINGTGGGKLSPRDHASRAQVAAVLARFSS